MDQIDEQFEQSSEQAFHLLQLGYIKHHAA
jgi:hypothetical protein